MTDGVTDDAKFEPTHSTANEIPNWFIDRVVTNPASPKRTDHLKDLIRRLNHRTIMSIYDNQTCG